MWYPKPMTRRDRVFSPYREALLSLPLSHVWRGYGSAVFFEFGELTPSDRTRRDGSSLNPRGTASLGIEAEWRIEGPRSILCGSSGEERLWRRTFDRLQGATVVEATLFGRLAEIDVALSNGLHIVSFAALEGQPEWSLNDCRDGQGRWLSVARGTLTESR